MKRIASLALAGILAVASVTPVLATSTNGTTPDGLTIPATVSMTVPAGPLTYTSANSWKVNVAITGLATNNQSGMNVKLTVNAAGTGLIAPANRQFKNATQTGWSGSAGTDTTLGQVTDTASWTVGNTGQMPTSATLAFDSIVSTTGMAPGTYTGSLNFVASTNP